MKVECAVASDRKVDVVGRKADLAGVLRAGVAALVKVLRYSGTPCNGHACGGFSEAGIEQPFAYREGSADQKQNRASDGPVVDLADAKPVSIGRPGWSSACRDDA